MKNINHPLLYKKFLNEQCTKTELIFLYTFFYTSDEKELRTLIQEQLIQLNSEQNVESTREEAILNEVFADIKRITHPKKTKMVQHLNINWRRLIRGAAAVVIIGLSLALYFHIERNNNKQLSNPLLIGNAAPGGNKATLTLSNGQTLILDSLKPGTIAQADGFKINKSDEGQISYEFIKKELIPNEEPAYHTITTPYGGQFKIILPDGTMVWLNAASSLKFPTQFSKNNRRVVLNGEGYFEVAKNTAKPFIVDSKGQEVQVVGTHFNIQAYEDETEVKTALLEGSVKVRSKDLDKVITLIPGQQTILEHKTFHVIPIKMDEVIAWKNGNFVFNNEELESIMKKITRWYNVQVSYEAAPAIFKQKFSGSISRFSNAKDVLDMLELTDAVHFKIEGRRVIIMN